MGGTAICRDWQVRLPESLFLAIGRFWLHYGTIRSVLFASLGPDVVPEPGSPRREAPLRRRPKRRAAAREYAWLGHLRPCAPFPGEPPRPPRPASKGAEDAAMSPDPVRRKPIPGV